MSALSPPGQAVGSNNTVFIIHPWFDPSYLRTQPGMLKCAAIILDILAFICVQSSAFWWNGRGVFFNLVAHLGFWISGILLLLYLWHVVEKYHNIKWLKVEMICYIVLTFLYLMASTIVVAFGSAAYSAGGFFGYLAMSVYGCDAYLKAKALQAGELAQGSRVVNKNEVTPPALP